MVREVYAGLCSLFLVRSPSWRLSSLGLHAQDAEFILCFIKVLYPTTVTFLQDYHEKGPHSLMSLHCSFKYVMFLVKTKGNLYNPGVPRNSQ